MFKNVTTKIKNAHLSLCQRIGAIKVCPTEKQGRAVLFIAGLAILALGLSHEVMADGGGALGTKYNDVRIANAVNAIMTYLEGTFGALIMAAAGIGAIMSAAFGQFKAALSLMVVAVGSFILRSLMSTFFNDDGIME
jgi:hypothetical protein